MDEAQARKRKGDLGGPGGGHEITDCVPLAAPGKQAVMIGNKMSSAGGVITSVQPVCTTDLATWGNGTSTSKVYAPVTGAFNRGNAREVLIALLRHDIDLNARRILADGPAGL